VGNGAGRTMKKMGKNKLGYNICIYGNSQWKPMYKYHIIIQIFKKK
jgi:hypothetical protein